MESKEQERLSGRLDVSKSKSKGNKNVECVPFHDLRQLSRITKGIWQKEVIARKIKMLFEEPLPQHELLKSTKHNRLAIKTRQQTRRS